MKKMIVALVAASLVAFGSAAVVLAVDGGSGGLAHNLAGPQGTCSKCHIPHGGQGDKIWAHSLTVQQDFGAAVHQMCYTCHRTGGAYTTTSGNNSVFNSGRYMNHVMEDWADIAGGLATFSTTLFPVDTTQTTTVPSTGSADHSNEGFYCGSCHNPHKQPYTATDGNGDYLRVDTNAAASMTVFGSSRQREGACLQCHPGKFTGAVASGHEGNCFVCHHPHEGSNMPDSSTVGDNLAEKILIADGTGSPFSAPPNVVGFTPGSYSQVIAGVCYDCHEDATGAEGSLPTGSTKVITGPAAGDDEHHPMGTNTAGTHAPGYTGVELTCTGCHDPHAAGQDFYLDPAAGTYTGSDTDDGNYCAGVCHTQNTVAALGTDGTDHNQTLASSGNSRADCFMCHYIHDGNSSTQSSPGVDPSEDVMMREDAADVRWAGAAGDTDTLDYEDMCGACHFDTVLSKGIGAAGSTFAGVDTNPVYFSHIFTGSPSAAGTNPTIVNMTNYGLLLSTGEYGTGTNTLYCGSCHLVHTQAAAGIDTDGNYFINTHNTGAVRSGLCTGCHSNAPMAQGGTTHPVGVPPTAPYTADPFPSAYASGGDGIPGAGITSDGTTSGDVQCETCHSFHGSNTNHLGGTPDHSTTGSQGKLMIIANGVVSGSSSLLCNNCHTNY